MKICLGGFYCLMFKFGLGEMNNVIADLGFFLILVRFIEIINFVLMFFSEEILL